ncbi:MAG: hypothetical protein WC602_00350 [archaeon]
MQNILNRTKGKYTSVFNLSVDQLSLRDLMNYTKTLMDTGKIEGKEYLFNMNKLHRTYATVTKNTEEIAKMKLEGKTLTQVYDDMFQFMQEIGYKFDEYDVQQCEVELDMIELRVRRSMPHVEDFHRGGGGLDIGF